MNALTTAEAVAWVDQNARMIQSHTRKYLSYAPYDQEDFLQDAYEAAIVAARVSADRQIPFPPCFWITFKGEIAGVTPYPDSGHHAGSFSPPTTMCFSSEFFDWGNNSAGTLFHIDIERVYWIIREHLTPADDELLEMALGIRGGRKAIREIARDFGCSPANIRQKLNRIYRRLARLVESGHLQIDLKDVDPREQASVFGTGKNQPNNNGRNKTQKGLARAA